MNIKKIEADVIHLLTLNSTPHGIALGVSLGVFIAITPTYGLHTLLVVVAAFLVPRANKVAILLGTNISLPPTLPFITWGGYEIGRFILRGDYPVMDGVYFRHLSHLSVWGILKAIKDLYVPLFVGSVVLGLICGAIFYIITFFVVRAIKNRKKGLNSI